MHALALRALSQGREGVDGEVFYCYDDSPRLSYEDFNMEILSLCGVRMLRWLRVPPLLVRLLGAFNDALRAALAALGVAYGPPLLTRYTAAIALTVFSVDTDKAARLFGYAPRYSWPQARDRTAAWVRTLGGGGGDCCIGKVTTAAAAIIATRYY
uniref:3 beta-hydroxysteroid dehydrogenase type 7-like n=1 Tax=Petromyzon marinus TaxID=7757 RepID=A0AAJ7WKB8_PETMA|nr:3 beta-hydroxysteroid dehydrogenase type 7-like [Petromyzon marinus]